MFTVATNSQTQDTYTGPLEPSTYHVGIKAGIAPTAWLSRKLPFENLSIGFGDNLPTHDINIAQELEKSEIIKEWLPYTPSDYANIPWSCFSLPTWVAVEVGYAYSDHLQLFGEFAWFQAKGKTFYEIPNLDRLPKEKRPTFSTATTQSFGGYVGFKHYGNLCFNCINPYWGLKIGLLHHDDITASLNNIPNDETLTSFTTLTRKFFVCNTVISGGIALGFDVRFSDCLRFQFGVEVIASGGRKGNADFKLFTPQNLPKDMTIGNIINEIKDDPNPNPFKDILKHTDIPDHIARAKVGDFSLKVPIENTSADLFIPITFGFVFEF